MNHISVVSSRQQEYHDLSHQLTFGLQLKPQQLGMVEASGSWFEMFEVRISLHLALATTCADEPFGSLGRSTCIDRNRPGDGFVGPGHEGFHPADGRPYPCHGERHTGMGKRKD